MNVKAGWKTTEFWTAIITQALTLLSLLGIITVQDVQTLEQALGQCAAAVFLLLTSAWVVVNYIRGRVALKSGQERGNGFRSILPLLLLSTLVVGLVGRPVPAAALPWRNQIEQRLRDQQQLIAALMQRQQTPAPLIIQQPPLQQLPIAGEPKQQLPIQGEPKQQLPIQGDPRQPLPITGPPQQQLPIQGPPQQQLPVMPPAHTGPQSYTVFIIRALYRPEEK